MIYRKKIKAKETFIALYTAGIFFVIQYFSSIQSDFETFERTLWIKWERSLKNIGMCLCFIFTRWFSFHKREESFHHFFNNLIKRETFRAENSPVDVSWGSVKSLGRQNLYCIDARDRRHTFVANNALGHPAI